MEWQPPGLWEAGSGWKGKMEDTLEGAWGRDVEKEGRKTQVEPTLTECLSLAKLGALHGVLCNLRFQRGPGSEGTITRLGSSRVSTAGTYSSSAQILRGRSVILMRKRSRKVAQTLVFSI